MKKLMFYETVLRRRGGNTAIIPAQSFGAELLTNGDFSTAALSGWTKLNDNGSTATISETAAGGGAGSGAATYNNNTSAVSLALEQDVMTIGDWYEIAGEMTAYTGGRLDITYSGAGVALPSLSSVRAVRQVDRATASKFRPQTGGALPRLFTVDNFSIKKLTMNAEQTAPSADMDVQLLYTLPASPRAGDRVFLPARISSFSSGNYWLVMLEYSGSQWNVFLYSVASHTRTQQKTISNVGNTNGLRFWASGTTIRMYTTADGGSNWTQRDTDLTLATYQTAIGYNGFAGSAFTLGLLSGVAA